MTKTAIKEKISDLQAELELLKKAVVGRPDFLIDEGVWRKIKAGVKMARSKLYQRHYGKK